MFHRARRPSASTTSSMGGEQRTFLCAGLFRRLMAVRRRHPARGSSLSDRISLRGPSYRGVTPAAIASCVRGLTVDVRPLALKVGTEMRFCICARVEGSRVSLSGSVSVTTSARHYNLAVTARLTKYSLRLQRHLVSLHTTVPTKCYAVAVVGGRLAIRVVALRGARRLALAQRR